MSRCDSVAAKSPDTGTVMAVVLSKNPIDAVRRADSTLDARRVATFVTAESLCEARPVCRLFPTCCSSASWPSPGHRRPAPAPGRQDHAPRATGTPRPAHPGHARYPPPLASTADREDIRRPRPSRTGPPTGHGHDPPAHRPDGPREPRVGRHPYSGCPRPPRSSGRAGHPRQRAQGARPKALFIIV